MGRVMVWEHDFRYGIHGPPAGVAVYVARGPACERCAKMPMACARSKKKARRAVYRALRLPHCCGDVARDCISAEVAVTGLEAIQNRNPEMLRDLVITRAQAAARTVLTALGIDPDTLAEVN